MPLEISWAEEKEDGVFIIQMLGEKMEQMNLALHGENRRGILKLTLYGEWWILNDTPFEISMEMREENYAYNKVCLQPARRNEKL